MASDITINACTLSNINGFYHQRDQEKLSLDSDNNFELWVWSRTAQREEKKNVTSWRI